MYCVLSCTVKWVQVTSGQCGSMGTVVVVVLLLVAGVRAEVGTGEVTCIQ